MTSRTRPNQSARRVILALLLLPLSVVSCKAPEKKPTSEKDYYLTATIESEKFGIDTVTYYEYYASQTRSGIQLTWCYFSVEGDGVTATVSDDSVGIDFLFSRPRQYKNLSFDEKTVHIDQAHPKVGELLTGFVKLSGEATNENGLNRFNMHAFIHCRLHDSTYSFHDFNVQVHRKYDSMYHVQEKNIAKRFPDSLKQLRIDFPYFDLVRNDLALFSKVEELGFDNFPSIPFDLFSDFKSIKKLQINADSVTVVSNAIGRFKHLEEFRVSAGAIDHIPDSIYTLVKLKTLDLNMTNATELSPAIKNLQALEELSIQLSSIKRLPREIYTLKHLKELGLPHDLTPFSIENLHVDSMHTLWASYKFLEFNRPYVKKLRHLDFLYVTDDEEDNEVITRRLAWIQKELPKVLVEVTSP